MTHLVLIGGPAASGKTTLGYEIARITSFGFLDKDTLTRPLVEALLTAFDSPGGINDRESDVYTQMVRPLEYECLLNAAIENISLGVSTIAVAPLLRELTNPQWLSHLREELLDDRTRVHCIWIDATDEKLHLRLIERGSPRDRHKLDDWADYIAAVRNIRPCEPCMSIDSSATENVAVLARWIVQKLSLG